MEAIIRKERMEAECNEHLQSVTIIFHVRIFSPCYIEMKEGRSYASTNAKNLLFEKARVFF